MFNPNSNRSTPDQDSSANDAIEELGLAPGIDPVLEACQDNDDAIPTEGWLIVTETMPGANTAIRIYGYRPGGLELSDPDRAYAYDGSVRAYLDLNGFNYLGLCCENKESYAAPSWNEIDGNSYDLQHQWRLTVVSNPEFASEEAEYHELLRSTDASLFLEGACIDGTYDIRINGSFPVCRVTDNRQELLRIVSWIAGQSGLAKDDIDTVIAVANGHLDRADETLKD